MHLVAGPAPADTGEVSTTQAGAIPCTAAAVHAWLATHDTEGLHRFDIDFHARLDAAAASYDLAPVDELIRHWWALIWGRGQHLETEEVAQFHRLDQRGDTSHLHRHDIAS